MNSNSLKRSFPLEIKSEDDDCGCSQKQSVNEELTFDQSEGVARFLSEKSNPLVEEEEEEEEDEMPPEMKDQMNGDEEEMEESRGAVEDVLRSLNRGEQDGYQVSVSEESHDDGHDEEEEEMDEVLQSVLDELNEDEEDPCWDGYTMAGTKMQDGEEVPNCVPEEDAEDYDPDESINEEGLLEAVLEDQVQELTKLDQLAEQVLNG